MQQRRFKTQVAMIAIASFLGVSSALAAEAKKNNLWEYQGKVGPENWSLISTDFRACGSGNRQSPIDLSGAQVSSLPEIKLDWPRISGEMVNHDYTLEIMIAPGATLSQNGVNYHLESVHFHSPSEHRIKDKQFPMEIHFVHRHPETKELAVLGVFVQGGGRNDIFSKLMRVLPENSEEKLVMPPDVDLNELLPQTRAYWSYNGSLTTPPCAEPVSWFVIKEPLLVQSKDIEKFRSVYKMNARPVQELNGRPVFASE